MTKFQFRLDSLLRLREARESEALRTLADAQRRLTKDRELKKKIQNQIKQSLENLSEIGKRPMRLADFQLEEDFIRGNRQRIVITDQAIHRSLKLVEQAMRHYLLARRQKMIVEKLKEKARADFKQASSRQEQKRIDDLIMTRLGREEREALEESEDVA